MKISKRKKIEENIKFLQMLKNLKKENMKILFNFLNDSSIELVSEMCYNVLFNTNLFKERKHLNKLKRHLKHYKQPISILAKKSTSCKRKRKILCNQKGEGLITGLISSVLPLLISLITGK